MQKMLIVTAILLIPTGALAGAQYCNDDVPYYIEEIPFGYALVHMAWAVYCKKNFRTDSPDYICDGRDDYRLKIATIDGDLTLTTRHGGDTAFYGCIFEHDTAN